MAAVVGLTLVKRMPYRGNANEEFSNQYWLSGGIPADAAAWKTLADALIAQERTVYSNRSTVVRAYGYASDDPTAPSVWSYDYLAAGTTVAGSLSEAGGTVCPGDSAVWARWKTSRVNTKGKAIFLRKYFHPALEGATVDTVLAGQKTALQAFATKLWDGSFLDGRTLRSQSHAETILGSNASTYVTTRTLKRRGKRPGS